MSVTVDSTSASGQWNVPAQNMTVPSGSEAGAGNAVVPDAVEGDSERLGLGHRDMEVDRVAGVDRRR